MHGLIAITDHDWFDFLRRQGPLEEVNFWRPSDVRTPGQLIRGMPVLFKLRKRTPYRRWEPRTFGPSERAASTRCRTAYCCAATSTGSSTGAARA
jgi:hypothetical protein